VTWINSEKDESDGSGLVMAGEHKTAEPAGPVVVLGTPPNDSGDQFAETTHTTTQVRLVRPSKPLDLEVDAVGVTLGQSVVEVTSPVPTVDDESVHTYTSSVPDLKHAVTQAMFATPVYATPPEVIVSPLSRPQSAARVKNSSKSADSRVSRRPTSAARRRELPLDLPVSNVVEDECPPPPTEPTRTSSRHRLVRDGKPIKLPSLASVKRVSVNRFR
jgi:hypothetical protein